MFQSLFSKTISARQAIVGWLHRFKNIFSPVLFLFYFILFLFFLFFCFLLFFNFRKILIVKILIARKQSQFLNEIFHNNEICSNNFISQPERFFFLFCQVDSASKQDYRGFSQRISKSTELASRRLDILAESWFHLICWD